MLDMHLALAKQRGLDLLTEAGADRAASELKAHRAKRRQRAEPGCARAAAGRPRTA